jgi:hypothetical protein
MSATQMIGKILLSLAIIGVLVGIIYEVRGFKQGRRRITKGQLQLRIITATLLVIILGMALAGSVVLPNQGADFASLTRHEKAIVLSYWCLCIGLSFLVVVLALADLRACLRTYAAQRGEMHLTFDKDEEHRN